MRKVWMVLIVLLLGLTPVVSQAQFDSVCAPLVQQALDTVGTSCSGLGRNSACYGFNRVGATFSQPQPDDFFTQPSDQAMLSQLVTLNTAPLAVDLAQWGIAVMNVQADIPDALPGRSVTFLLFGDVVLENAVDSAASPGAAIALDVTTLAQSLMRTRPTPVANTSALIPPATTLSADLLSNDGAWVRVVYEDRAGWLPVAGIDPAVDVTVLPTQNRAPYTPMQAVRLTTNVLGVSCAEAPPSLMVMQGPQEMTVNLTVNGAELNIGSTIALWTVGGQMLLAVIDGGVYTADGTYIPAGFISIIPLDESGNITGEWSAPRPLTLEEWLLFEPLENVPPSILNYPIIVPSELIATLLPPTPTPTSRPVRVPTQPPPPPQIIQIDCTGFRPTSPLDGLPFGATTFYWDGVSSTAITSYQVNLYRDGALVSTFSSPGGVTRADVDLSALPLGGAYTWDVQALVSGVVVCRSAAAGPIARAFPPDTRPAEEERERPIPTPMGTEEPYPPGYEGEYENEHDGENTPPRENPVCQGLGNPNCEPRRGG